MKSIFSYCCKDDMLIACNIDCTAVSYIMIVCKATMLTAEASAVNALCLLYLMLYYIMICYSTLLTAKVNA